MSRHLWFSWIADNEFKRHNVTLGHCLLSICYTIYPLSLKTINPFILYFVFSVLLLSAFVGQIRFRFLFIFHIFFFVSGFSYRRLEQAGKIPWVVAWQILKLEKYTKMTKYYWCFTVLSMCIHIYTLLVKITYSVTLKATTHTPAHTCL